MKNRVLLAREWRPTEYILHEGTVDAVILDSATRYDFSSVSPKKQESLLGQLLLFGNIELFNQYFTSFYQDRLAENLQYRIPTAFQQGLTLWEYIQTKKRPSNYPYDPELLDRFEKYLALSHRLEQSGGRDRSAAEQLQTEFFDSYWYYQMFIFQYADY